MAYVCESASIFRRHTVAHGSRRGVRPMPTKLSVVPQLATARGTTKPDSEKHVVVSVEAEKSAAHRDADDTPKLRWSDRGLQVLDLKAAGALSSSAVTEASCT